MGDLNTTMQVKYFLSSEQWEGFPCCLLSYLLSWLLRLLLLLLPGTQPVTCREVTGNQGSNGDRAILMVPHVTSSSLVPPSFSGLGAGVFLDAWVFSSGGLSVSWVFGVPFCWGVCRGVLAGVLLLGVSLCWGLFPVRRSCPSSFSGSSQDVVLKKPIYIFVFELKS